MVVVFDEKEAIKQTAEFQRRKQTWDVIFWVSTAAGIGGCVFLFVSIFVDFVDWIQFTFRTALLLGLIVQHWSKNKSLERPEPIVAYWMAIRGKKVLHIRAEDASVSWEQRKRVCVLAEDADGVVGTSFVGVLKRMESTRVREVTVDLNEGVVYVPCEKA